MGSSRSLALECLSGLVVGSLESEVLKDTSASCGAGAHVGDAGDLSASWLMFSY